MKLIYIRTDFPDGRSRIIMKNTEFDYKELVHFIMVLSNKGTLWVDVFWPYDEEVEENTYRISEQQFWLLFREWRLQGMVLGDNEKAAENIAKKLLGKKKREKEA